MGKKKLVLKPVNRGFATTSIASKKAPQGDLLIPEGEGGPALDTAPDSASAPPGTQTPARSGKDSALANGPTGSLVASTNVKEDWEDEKVIEEAALQGLVERLQDKGEKEVARVLKAIEYDKRLAISFPRLEINRDIRDRVLELALSDEASAHESQVPSIRLLAPRSIATETDKSLLRLFIAFHVLSRLGFSEDRISPCLLEGGGESQGWEEGLEWMWLHLSEDECVGRGEYAPKEALSLDGPDDLLLDVFPNEPEPCPEFRGIDDNQANDPPHQSKLPSSVESASLFQSIESSQSSESESDSDPDLEKVNIDWATLMLELDNLRISAREGGGKSKIKKGKANGVVLETPEMRKIKDKIGKVEKEYRFSRKKADVLLKSLKARRDAEILEARLKGNTVQKASPDMLPDEENPATHASVDHLTDIFAESLAVGDEDNGGLFGNMLDEPSGPALEAEETNLNTTILVRSMPIPKQFSFAGNIPKQLLRTNVAKSSKQAVLNFARLSGGSRAARAGLEIRWSPKRRRVWRMDDIACEDMIEAENYVSTLALSELLESGELNGVNWRTLPPAYRNLWGELEVARKERDDGRKRLVWGTIRKVLEQKTGRDVPIVSERTSQAGETVPREKENETTPSYDRPSERLQVDLARRRASSAYQSMLQHRSQLPIASFREEIVRTLESSQIMVLSGETGCGKSTQLPSFILEDQLSKGRPCKIFVTEPRRISAISLAQRVSQELGDAPAAMGTNSSLVGYSIRLEAKIAATTRLAFVTNGIALRMLEGGSGGNSRSTAFDEVTHIIIDEVHERSIESDFLLIVIKSLIQQRKDLKVVLMSATLDTEKISNFFGGCPFLSVPGRTFPVQVNYLEDAVELSGWHIDESSQYAIRPRSMKSGAKQLEWNEDSTKVDDEDDSDTETVGDPTKLPASPYSVRTVSTVNFLDSRQIPYDLIMRLLQKICFEDPEFSAFSQAVLIFMPGLAEIRRMNDMIQGHPAFGSGEFVIYPLHSTISSEGQSAVFDLPPPGMRKIVISTNIAETGVTIPDITCVIDSGKHREMRYDEKRQIYRLVETFVARNNAKQRRGRAGRVQEGLAFHLFTKARHDTQLAEHSIPEILRLSLQDLALRIKILKVKLGTSIEDVLLRALDPPSSANIQRAIASLVEVKALTLNEEITPMGRLLSKLPMDVHLGKFLLVAALFRCLDPALTIAATLNSKSPFVTPFGLEGAADAAKKSFASGNSDFLTMANVFASWRRASDSPSFVKTFCERNFISHQTLQQIEELRQQLLAYLIDSSFVDGSPRLRQEISQARFSRGFRTRFVTVPPEFDVNAESVQVLGAALATGLYPKLISLDGSGGMKTIINQQPVAIHPSSVNFRLPKSEFGTSYLTYFTIMQSKRLYAWETGPVDDRALALLCGDQADFRLSASSLQLDRKIRYHIEPKSLLAIKLLRQQFALAMSTRLRGKSLSEGQERWFELGLMCLRTGIWEGEEQTVGMV